MRKRSTKIRERPMVGRADLARLRAMTEDEIRQTSPEELRDLPADFWDDAVLVPPPGKVPISLRVDADIVDYFKAGGPRYQSRMNAVLRAYVERAREGRKRRG